MPLSFFRKKMGRNKRPFHFHSCVPFLPHPKTFSVEVTAAVRALSLDGSSPLQQNFNKLICQSDIPSPKKWMLWKFSNRWECSLWLPCSGSLDYPAGSSFQTRPKTSPQKRRRGCLHQYPIFPKSSNQRLPFSQSDTPSKKAFQKEALAILSKATNTVGLATR